jgi:hypothetical protein
MGTAAEACAGLWKAGGASGLEGSEVEASGGWSGAGSGSYGSKKV